MSKTRRRSAGSGSFIIALAIAVLAVTQPVSAETHLALTFEDVSRLSVETNSSGPSAAPFIQLRLEAPPSDFSFILADWPAAAGPEPAATEGVTIRLEDGQTDSALTPQLDRCSKLATLVQARPDSYRLTLNLRLGQGGQLFSSGNGKLFSLHAGEGTRVNCLLVRNG